MFVSDEEVDWFVVPRSLDASNVEGGRRRRNGVDIDDVYHCVLVFTSSDELIENDETIGDVTDDER
jgi:hypothetical protein